MKKFLLLCSIILCACNMVHAAGTYYCPSTDGSYYRMRDIYNPKEDCSSFDTKFFGKDAYNSCLADIKVAKRKYMQGKCEPIIVKTHNFETCKGEVEVALKAKKVFGYSTSGGNCMNQLKSLYRNYEY